jgi:hypothetical protein
MNDGHDPLFAVRTYACPKSQKARDSWLSYRESQGKPVRPMTEKHGHIPGEFARQFKAMRNKSG